jgi:hypothetical protein
MPVIEVVEDSFPEVVEAPEFRFPIEGTRLVDSELILTGVGTPRSGIQVLIDDEVVTTTRAGRASGNWSARAVITEPGEHKLVVQALMVGGVVGAESDPITVVYAGPIPGQEEMVETDAETEAAPAAESTDASAEEAATEEAAESEAAEEAATEEAAESEAAEEAAESEATEEAATEEAAESEATEESAESTEDASTEDASTEDTSATASGGVAAFSPELIFPIDGADVLVGQLTVIGSGDPGTEVEVLDGATVLGVAEVGPDGEWTFTFTPAEATYQVVARVPGDESMATEAIAVRVTADEDDVDCVFSNPGINRGDNYIVGTCDTLNEISEELGVDYDDLVALNPQVNPDVDLIYPGQILNLP